MESGAMSNPEIANSILTGDYNTNYHDVGRETSSY